MVNCPTAGDITTAYLTTKRRLIAFLFLLLHVVFPFYLVSYSVAFHMYIILSFRPV